QAWMNRTVKFDWDIIFFAAGALTGLRTSASMLLGGTLCWAVFIPILQYQGIAPSDMDPKDAFKTLVQWSLWGGVSCMITSGLLSVVFQWRSALRALGSLGRLFSRDDARELNRIDAMDAIEAPTSWFIAGQL